MYGQLEIQPQSNERGKTLGGYPHPPPTYRPRRLLSKTLPGQAATCDHFRDYESTDIDPSLLWEFGIRPASHNAREFRVSASALNLHAGCSIII